MIYDVIIIGAGAAGLMAAMELSKGGKSVAVVEALARTGGRMYTVDDPAIKHAVEMGAEFVHGDLPLTKALLQQAGASLQSISGSLWQHHHGTLKPQQDFIDGYDGLEQKFKAVQADLPVAQFIDQYLQEPGFEEVRISVQNYVEGYYAADTERASTLALVEELTRDDEPQYRIAGGYRLLTQYLEEQCRRQGVSFFLDSKVARIGWQPGSVEVFCDGASYRGGKVLVTVSVGVLKSGALHFAPGLPKQAMAAEALGYGHVVKMNLLFKQAFWKKTELTQGNKLSDLQFLFSNESIPTWWSQHPGQTNLLTGWLGGPRAEALMEASHDELLQLALESLTRIFTLEPAYLWQDLLGAWSHNWSADPLFHGAYSYEVVNGDAHRQVLQQPVEETIFFAGEALHHGPEIGTVEAALKSGQEAAEKILSSRGSPESQ